MPNENTLKQIPGQKIRRQFFNIPIYLILVVDMALLSAWTAVAIHDPEITFTFWLETSAFLLLISMALILPLAILSLLNRFCFGRIICVLDDKGLHYNSGFIEWKQIKKAVYEPDIPSEIGRNIYCCNQLCLTLKPFQKEITIELDHAPFLLFRKVRKHCPGIPCKLTRWGIAMILCLTVVLDILSVLCVLAA